MLTEDHTKPDLAKRDLAKPDLARPNPAQGPARSLVRGRENRLLGGVAGGLADRLDVDPVFVRAAFVALSCAGGAGLMLYAVLWVVMVEPEVPSPSASTREPRSSQGNAQRAVGFAFIVAGALLLLREVGLWFGDALVWPVALGSAGSAVIWSRGDQSDRSRWIRLTGLPGGPVTAVLGESSSRPRVIAGGVLVLVGMVSVLAANASLDAAAEVLLAVGVTFAGAALLLGPWILRLAKQVGDERRERIRSEERSDMAAHLHDSVLQTLALIQRAADPREMATLARSQERELRAWLYRPPGGGADSDAMSTALDDLAGRIERMHRVKVDVVVVGDGPLGPRSQALLQAAGEAIANAAIHSGAPTVSVYVEGTKDSWNAYISDEGKGFALEDVPLDRRGIADSIVGRVQRHAGTATVTSTLGEGTEVHLRVGRDPA